MLEAVSQLSTVLIKIPAWGTVTLIEMIWTVIGVLSSIIVVADFHQASVDYKLVISSSRNGAMKILAWGYVRRGALRGVTCASLLTVGVYSCIQASPNGVNYISIVGIVITVCFFFIGSVTALQAFFDYRQRKQVAEELERADIPQLVAAYNEISDKRRAKKQGEDMQ